MEIKTIILDTNAYVEFKKGNKDAIEIIRRVNNILLCPIVIGELIGGFVLGNKEKKNRKELSDFMSSKRVFSIKIDNNTSEIFGQIFKELQLKGKPIPTNDMWIGAIAKQYKLPIFTYDKHFSEISSIKIIKKQEDII